MYLWFHFMWLVWTVVNLMLQLIKISDFSNFYQKFHSINKRSTAYNWLIAKLCPLKGTWNIFLTYNDFTIKYVASQISRHNAFFQILQVWAELDSSRSDAQLSLSFHLTSTLDPRQGTSHGGRALSKIWASCSKRAHCGIRGGRSRLSYAACHCHLGGHVQQT